MRARQALHTISRRLASALDQWLGHDGGANPCLPKDKCEVRVSDGETHVTVGAFFPEGGDAFEFDSYESWRLELARAAIYKQEVSLRVVPDYFRTFEGYSKPRGGIAGAYDRVFKAERRAVVFFRPDQLARIAALAKAAGCEEVGLHFALDAADEFEAAKSTASSPVPVGFSMVSDVREKKATKPKALPIGGVTYARRSLLLTHHVEQIGVGSFAEHTAAVHAEFARDGKVESAAKGGAVVETPGKAKA